MKLPLRAVVFILLLTLSASSKSKQRSTSHADHCLNHCSGVWHACMTSCDNYLHCMECTVKISKCRKDCLTRRGLSQLHSTEKKLYHVRKWFTELYHARKRFTENANETCIYVELNSYLEHGRRCIVIRTSASLYKKILSAKKGINILYCNTVYLKSSFKLPYLPE